jgi:hypothetical protein
MLEKFGGKMFESGVQDSLQRLKQRAEARYREQISERP